MSDALRDTLYDEAALGKAYDGRLLMRLWPFIRPYKRLVFATLTIFVPIFVLELAPAWVVKVGLDQFTAAMASDADAARSIVSAESPLSGIDRWLESIQAWMSEPPMGMSNALWLGLLYLGLVASSTGLMVLHSILLAATGQHAMRDLRCAVFAHIQKLETSYFDQMPVGRLVTRATNDVENLSEMFSQGLVALITDIVKMIGFAVVLFMISPKLALATFGIVPILVVVAIFFRWKVREAFRDVRVRIARINAHIQETVSGMKVVQLFTRESRNMRDFDRMNADHRDAWRRSIHYEGLLFSSIEIATGVTIAIIIGVGTGLAEAGLIYVFIDYMSRFFMPLRDLSAKYAVMQSGMASAERVFEVLDTEPKVVDRVHEAPAVENELEGQVEFEHVWFSYSEDGSSEQASSAGRSTPKSGRPDESVDWVLRDVSFKVKKGEKVALVGATGAGKTTIIKLLTRLYDVQHGRVLVDGIDVRDMPQHVLRKRVATVLQDVFLFSGSVARNIALGSGDLDVAAIERAAQSVEAHRFIERLPQGYDTEILERGANFSAGQRQILSFARALSYAAPILVLDEATSSIDKETEAAIQRGIRVLMEGKTAIAIAHRLSTIRDADRIYVLSGGALIESGSHAELLAAGGHYAKLHRLQAEFASFDQAAQPA